MGWPRQLYVKPEGGIPISLDGTLLQESILPPWFVKALIALLVLLIALVLIWLLLLEPSCRRLGTASPSPLASLRDNVNAALGNAGLPTMAPAGGGGGHPPRPGLRPRPAGDTRRRCPRRPHDRVVIRASATPWTVASTRRTPRSRGTLVTDLVFSNPRGGGRAP